jgi:hypothetical protein
MVRPLPFGARFMSGALAFALAFVSVATCFAGTLQLPERSHHASCHGMQTEGGESAISTLDQASDCCAVQRAILGLGGASDALAAPPLAPAVVVPLSLLGAPPFDSRAPISSSPPTYLLISVFRI